MPPNRLIRMMVILPTFINQFFDMNPLSQLQIIETSDGLAKIVSTMSGTLFLFKSSSLTLINPASNRFDPFLSEKVTLTDTLRRLEK